MISRGAISVRVLEPADALLVSMQPNATKIIGGGCAAGIILGVLAAILRDRLDGRVRSAEEVSALTGTPVLGVIPRLPRFARTRVARHAARALRKFWMLPSSFPARVAGTVNRPSLQTSLSRLRRQVAGC